MAKRKMQIWTVAALMLFIALMVVFYLFFLAGSEPEARVDGKPEEGATIDLRDYDFAQGGAKVFFHRLDCFPEEYLLPEELTYEGPLSRSEDMQFGTVRVTMFVPEDEIYYLRFTIPGYAGRIFVNGEFVRDVGHPGYSYEDTVIDYRPQSLQAVPKDGAIELVLHAANFTRAGGELEGMSVHVGLANLIEPQYLLLDAPSYIVMASLFFAVLLFLGVWIFYPSQKQNLWFALCCLPLAVRAGLLGDTLRQVLPFMPRIVGLRMEYASVPVFMFFAILYIDAVFPGVVHRLVKRPLLAVLVVYAVCCVALPTYIISETFHTVYVIAGTAIVYIALRILWQLFRKRPGLDQVVMLLGMLVFLVGAFAEILNFRSVFGFAGSVMSIAMLIFAVFQMVSLFIGNTRQMLASQEAEQKLVAENDALARLDKLKDRFVGSAAHEMKTPLTVISGYAQRVQADFDNQEKSEENQKRLRLISSEAARMGVTVGQMLDISRIEEDSMVYDMKPCSITQIIQETVSTYYPHLNKNGNTLRLKPDGSLPLVEADAGRISQVILNLLTNALRHTRGGEVRVTTGMSDEGLMVSVADTGTGIDERVLPRLFERFSYVERGFGEAESPAPSGTGLGLYICKHIVEDHGGRIFAESVLGVGSTFHFILPRLSAPE